MIKSNEMIPAEKEDAEMKSNKNTEGSIKDLSEGDRSLYERLLNDIPPER